MIFSRESRAKVSRAERHWIAKFVLRLLTIVVVIVAFGLAGYSYSLDYAVIWISVPLGVSICWNVANVIVRLCRARPMHPGANVGMDLILWLAFAAALGFSYFGAILLLEYNPTYYSGYYGDDPSYYSSDYGYYDSDTSDYVEAVHELVGCYDNFFQCP